MAKRKERRYSPGRRSENRLKIKARMQQEAIIGGVTGPSSPGSDILERDGMLFLPWGSENRYGFRPIGFEVETTNLVLRRSIKLFPNVGVILAHILSIQGRSSTVGWTVLQGFFTLEECQTATRAPGSVVLPCRSVRICRFILGARS
jgi:hypothetical protein